MLIAIVLVFSVAVGLLFCDPIGGQAVALVRAQARDRHIAYLTAGPGVLRAGPDRDRRPQVQYRSRVDPLAMGRVVVSRITGRVTRAAAPSTSNWRRTVHGRPRLHRGPEAAAMAVKLNQTYSLPQILRMYAEVAYYGHGYYGLDAASCGYFLACRSG